METKAQDQGLQVAGLRDGRLLRAEQVSAGRSLPAEKQQAAIRSFEPLIDSATAAELLRVHRKTLERMALRGEVPAHKVGRFWRYRCSELDARMVALAGTIESPAVLCNGTHFLNGGFNASTVSVRNVDAQETQEGSARMAVAVR